MRGARKVMRNKHVKISDFDVHETVGKGGFGRVRLCAPKAHLFNRGDADKLKNYGLALKLMNKTKLLQSMGGLKGSVESLRHEVTILAALEHPFIINLLTMFHDEKRVMILYEFINGGELRTLLREEEIVLREFNALPVEERKQKSEGVWGVSTKIRDQLWHWITYGCLTYLGPHFFQRKRLFFS